MTTIIHDDMKNAKRISIFLFIFFGFIILENSCKKDNQVPVLTTSVAYNITLSSANCSGTVKADGGSKITIQGVCWSTNSLPSINDSKVTDNSGSVTFTVDLANLSPNTKYYVRTFATNNVGTGYGNVISFTTLPNSGGTVTDIDGNVYHTLTIGTQVWLVENLKTTRYRNGDLIGTTTPVDKNISGEVMPKYQWPCFDDESNVATYGRYYTWYAVDDSRRISPSGWHVSTNNDWIVLTSYLITHGYDYQGIKNSLNIAKSMSATWGWVQNSVVGAPGNDISSNNSSGFTALPGGYHSNWMFYYFFGLWWTSTDLPERNTAYFCEIAASGSVVSVGSYSLNGKYIGMSVRCVRDN